MEILRILRYEVLAFLWALIAILAYRMLTREVSLKGIFGCSMTGRPVTPERVQLLMATLAMSLQFLSDVVHGSGNTMPNVNSNWLTVFGASSGVYVATKATRAFIAPRS